MDVLTTSPRTSAHAPAIRLPLRIQLRDSTSTGHVDGVWWPQSRDLQIEAADLVDHFPDQVGYIERILFSRPDWDRPVVKGRGVSRIQAGRGPVRVGSFPSDDTQLMIVLMASGRRVSLKVIGSATDPIEAERQFGALGEAERSGDTVEGAHTRWDAEEPYS